MAIAGPRLDRPSGVGDDGRPRAASLTVAAVVIVALAVVSLVLVDMAAALGLLGLAVVFVVAGLALLNRDGLGEQVVGHLLYHPGSLFVVGLLFATFVLGDGLLLGGLFLALLGIAASWANVFVEDDFHDATVAAAISYGTSIGWFVVVILLLFIATGVWVAVSDLLASTDPVESLLGFLSFLAVAGVAVHLAIWALPVAALTPKPQREARRARLWRWSRLALGLTALAVVAMTAMAAFGGPDAIDRLAADSPAIEGLFVGLSSPFALGPLLLVTVLAVLLAVGGLLARKLADLLDAGNDRLLAAAIAGLFFAVLIAGYLWQLFAALLVYAPVVLGFALLTPLILIVVSFLALAAMDGGFIPARAAGPAFGAAGLFVAGIGAALVHLPGPLVFAFVAGAVVVWDVSTFGLGLTVELGHRPETRRLELYHAVLSIGVGLAAVLAVTGLDVARQTLDRGAGNWAAVAVAVLGAIALTIAVARRGVDS